MRVVVSLVLCLLYAVGCSNDENNVSIEGIKGEILEIDDNSILIKDDINRVDLKYSDSTVFEGKEFNDLDVGDKVRTRYVSQPLDSNPIQATASKIEFIE